MNKTVMNEDCARELALYIENDYQLYTQRIAPYIQCLHKKRIKGTYDPNKALPGWERITTEGAKKYERDFLDVRYYYVFNRATREEAARYLQGFFLDMVYEGCNNLKKYYNIELSGLDAERLSYYLTKNNFKFEISGAYNLTHFEILATPKQADAINAWIDDQL